MLTNGSYVPPVDGDKYQIGPFTFFSALPHHLPLMLCWANSPYCVFLNRPLKSYGAGHFSGKREYSIHRRVCYLFISRANFFISSQLCTYKRAAVVDTDHAVEFVAGLV